MPKITEKEIEYVAKLARLELEPREVEKMTHHIGLLLDYAAKLQELDTGDIQATTHSQDISNAFREDVAFISLDREAALQNAPQQNGEFFVVPRII
ncbi:MAG: Asp-tRNA(Asn)/Glu-tRNA(Gln) amidotransferase subunit GatC [Desulfobulbaceae bacterium]|nr:Asp-tRNA(Asn)/Glu-tRNA(Gln) amidotransferase subunit GatC [Desulfobulbaceae bacterium]